MGRTACTEPHCLYKGALYFYLYYIQYILHNSTYVSHVCKIPVTLRRCSEIIFHFSMVLHLTHSISLSILFPTVQQSLVRQGVLIIGVTRSHSDTPQSIGLLWTSDRSVADTRYPRTQRDSNPQSHKQEASNLHLRPLGHRDRPYLITW